MEKEREIDVDKRCLGGFVVNVSDCDIVVSSNFSLAITYPFELILYENYKPFITQCIG